MERLINEWFRWGLKAVEVVMGRAAAIIEVLDECAVFRGGKGGSPALPALPSSERVGSVR